MKRVPLACLCKGDVFYLKDDINSPRWVRGRYDLSSCKYSIYPHDGVFRELLRKPSYLVFVESISY